MRRPRFLRSTLGLVLLLAASPAASAPPATSGSVKGTWTFKGKELTPEYVYALAKPGILDKTKEDLEILFTTEPISERRIFDLSWVGGVRLIAEFRADGSFAMITVFDAGTELGTGGGDTPISFEKRAFDKERISGRIRSKGVVELRGSETLILDLTFDAPFLRERKLSPPSAADKSAAARSPQVKVFEALVIALNEGNGPVVKRLFSARLNDPARKDGRVYVANKLTSPAFGPLTYLRVTESGDTATLEAENRDEKWLVDFVREGGAWKFDGLEPKD